MTAHGYNLYTHGCRCEVCRRAKADYMRDRRAEARKVAQKYTDPRPAANVWADGAGRYLATITRHGTRFGYEEKGCRCADCTAARTSSDARYRSGGAA